MPARIPEAIDAEFVAPPAEQRPATWLKRDASDAGHLNPTLIRWPHLWPTTTARNRPKENDAVCRSTGRNDPHSRWADFIGFSCANDGSARAFQLVNEVVYELAERDAGHGFSPLPVP